MRVSQIVEAYVRDGLTTAVYIHFMVFGVNPHVGPMALLHCMRMPFAFLHLFSMCSFHESLLSRVTPKNLVELLISISVLFTFRGLELVVELNEDKKSVS